MSTLNVFNKTGVRGDWAVAFEGGDYLATGLANWAVAVDAAKELAAKHKATEVLLHKLNGNVSKVALGRRHVSQMLTPLPAVSEGDAVYIARVEQNMDSDSKQDRVRQCTTLEDAVKALPKVAHELNWSSVDLTKFTSFVLGDGRIVSIEKTSV